MHFGAGEIGDTDCEFLASGSIAQPFNAWSSLAYVVVGLVIIARARRSDSGQRLPQVLYGALLVGVGLGSFVFHGPQPSWARFAHDLAITATIAFIAVADVGLLFGWARPVLLAGWTAIVAVAAGVMAVAPDTAIIATAPVALVAVAGEVVIYRRRLRPGAPERVLRLYGAIGVAMVLGGLLNVLGRTGAPLCDPDGLVQLHGLWHVLTAVGFGLWAWIAFAGPRVEAGGVPSEVATG